MPDLLFKAVKIFSILKILPNILILPKVFFDLVRKKFY